MAGWSRRSVQQLRQRSERVDFHGNLDLIRHIDIDIGWDDYHDHAFADRHFHTVEQFVLERSDRHLYWLDGANQIRADAG